VFSNRVYILLVAYISFNKHLSKILQKYCRDITKGGQTMYWHLRLS